MNIEITDEQRQGTDEQRQGATGVWTFVLKTPEGKILARSEWGTNYEFHEQYWLALTPILPSRYLRP